MGRDGGRGPRRLRDDLDRLQHRSGGVREFSLGAARILAPNAPRLAEGAPLAADGWFAAG